VRAPARPLRQPYGDQHVIRSECGGEVVEEEVRGRDLSPPSGAGDLEDGIRGDGDGRQVTGRISVRQAAAERSPVAHLAIGNRARRLGDKCCELVDQWVREHLGVRGGGADHDRVAVVAYAPHLVDATDVNHECRRGQTQPQQRDETLAAGEHLGVLTALGEQPHCLVDTGRLRIVELRRNH
jgi:hypothetical protein